LVVDTTLTWMVSRLRHPDLKSPTRFNVDKPSHLAHNDFCPAAAADCPHVRAAAGDTTRVGHASPIDGLSKSLLAKGLAGGLILLMSI
jgi:hypothetical protein